MATIKYLAPAPGLQGTGALLNPISSGQQTGATASTVTVADAYGFSVVFLGSFTVVNGVATGGTVTGFDGFAGETRTMHGEGYAVNFSLLDVALTTHDIGIASDLFFFGAKQIGSKLGDFLSGAGKLLGKGGDDFLIGSDKADTLKGGDGDDTLVGNGPDKLLGGDGDDSFVVFLDSPGVFPIVRDFHVGEDFIALGSNVFEQAVGVGQLNSSEFGIGPVAEGSETFFYNKKSGGLFFDADSTGAGAAVQIADLDPHLHLKAKHLYVGDFV